MPRPRAAQKRKELVDQEDESLPMKKETEEEYEFYIPAAAVASVKPKPRSSPKRDPTISNDCYVPCQHEDIRVRDGNDVRKLSVVVRPAAYHRASQTTEKFMPVDFTYEPAVSLKGKRISNDTCQVIASVQKYAKERFGLSYGRTTLMCGVGYSKARPFYRQSTKKPPEKRLFEWRMGEEGVDYLKNVTDTLLKEDKAFVTEIVKCVKPFLGKAFERSNDDKFKQYLSQLGYRLSIFEDKWKVIGKLKD